MTDAAKATSGPSLSDQDLEQLTSLFRLLSDKTRLNILMILCDGEHNVMTLCGLLALPQPTVSHHLGLLRMNNVIGSRRAGKQVFYGLNGRVDLTTQQALSIALEKVAVRISALGAVTEVGSAARLPE